MRIETWMQERETPGTLAHIARQVLARDVAFRAAEKTLRRMYFLELVMKHGGSQQKAADSIGVKVQIVNREMRSLRLKSSEITKIAELVQHRSDEQVSAE